MQHHLIDLLFKDGVYDPRNAIETFSRAFRRHGQSENGLSGLPNALEPVAVVAKSAFGVGESAGNLHLQV